MIRLFPAFLFMSFLISCGGSDQKKDDKGSDFKKEMTESDSAKANRKVKVGNKVFSVPSPIQTAYLIEESGASYNEELLNDPKNKSKYATKFQKAVNLGIYGADLGYVTIYNKEQDYLKYLKAVQKLARDVGVESAFDKELVKKFKKNMGNRDSMLSLVSDAFKAADRYLKKNKRDDVAGLILAGGWIESLHFASSIAKNKGNKKVKRRVAMQRSSLNNLIKLLGNKRGKEGLNNLIEDLEGLYGIYDEIKIEYEYHEPETKPEKKLTILKSKTVVDISDAQVKKIHEKINKIRNQITGQ